MSNPKEILFESLTDIFYEDGTSVSKIAEPAVIPVKKVISRVKTIVNIEQEVIANKGWLPSNLSNKVIYEA